MPSKNNPNKPKLLHHKLRRKVITKASIKARHFTCPPSLELAEGKKTITTGTLVNRKRAIGAKKERKKERNAAYMRRRLQEAVEAERIQNGLVQDDEVIMRDVEDSGALQSLGLRLSNRQKKKLLVAAKAEEEKRKVEEEEQTGRAEGNHIDDSAMEVE